MTPVESFSSAARVSSPVCFSASGDMPELRLQSCPESSGVSCDEFLVGKAFLGAGDDEAIQPFQCGDFDVAIVEPERKFVHIPIQVFRAGMVVDAMQPAFHHSPNALYAVRGNAAAHIFTGAMVDAGAVEKQPVKTMIGRSIIGDRKSVV